MSLARQQRGRRGPARLVIVDDHELARAGLRSMLVHEPDLEVVGEAATGGAALEVCGQMRPDLVLMDVRMPDMDGIAATRAIKAEFPTTCVLIVTTYADPDYLFGAVAAGAAGYVLKDATHREIVRAIRATLRGEPVLESRLATQLLQRLSAEVGVAEPPPGEYLTPREREVLRLVADGQTNREIAGTLSVSPATVKTHVERAIAKLGASDRTQAAVKALRLGLIEGESS